MAAAAFLSRVVPETSLSRDGVLTAALCLLGLSAGLHFFLGWLYREMHRQPGKSEDTGDGVSPVSSSTDQSLRHWPMRWTGVLLGLLVLMFIAGLSAVLSTIQAGECIELMAPRLGAIGHTHVALFFHREDDSGVVGAQARDGMPVTVASTGALARRVDEHQYATRTGPCLDALRRGNTVRVDSYASATEWPDFAPAARREGVRSSLSTNSYDQTPPSRCATPRERESPCASMPATYAPKDLPMYARRS